MSKEHILDTAYKMAQRDGFAAITRDGVATEAGVAMGSVNHHFKIFDNLKNEVLRLAVEREELKIIAAGIVAGNELAVSLPQSLKIKALQSLA